MTQDETLEEALIANAKKIEEALIAGIVAAKELLSIAKAAGDKNKITWCNRIIKNEEQDLRDIQIKIKKEGNTNGKSNTNDTN
ncbi:MAG: hypothetical protein CVU95_08435 [Firmicutes bacterium HGW-Firmicutes-2]|jgi:ferritin-like metal-binding protein YciE|nr:MAG: hypothetical protein CVU95_08435 [Firmicutes bacterium HGW-Firmicutes-2]